MAATESIRALRENPAVFTQGVGSLFGVPEESDEESDAVCLQSFQASPNAERSDEDILEEAREVIKQAAKLQTGRRSMEAFNLIARSSLDFARIATCLQISPASAMSKALASELGTKSTVNLLRQAREDAEATNSVRDMTSAALKVLRDDQQLSAADLAHNIANIATLYGYLRDWTMQRELCEEVLKLQATCLPTDDPDVVRMKQHLGVACLNLGDWNTARQLSQEVLKVQLRQLGPNHVDVALT
jgi:DNA-binding transcriptional regulator YiaG